MAAVGGQPVRSPFRLYTRLLPVLSAATLVGSFIEADQRGLLFQSDDIALLAEEAAMAVPNQGMGMDLRVGGARDRSALGSDMFRRSLGSRVGSGNLSGLSGNNSVSPAQGSSRTILDQPAREERPIQTLGSESATPAAVAPRRNSSSGPGFPDSPIGLIAVGANNPGPVVPAVPEPASWLLMIIGVGWLGVSLRRRKRPNQLGAVTPASAI